jgi:hypothetical protein
MYFPWFPLAISTAELTCFTFSLQPSGLSGAGRVEPAPELATELQKQWKAGKKGKRSGGKPVLHE